MKTDDLSETLGRTLAAAAAVGMSVSVSVHFSPAEGEHGRDEELAPRADAGEPERAMAAEPSRELPRFHPGDRVLTDTGEQGTVVERVDSLSGRWSYTVEIQQPRSYRFDEDKLRPDAAEG